jgi:hypothetical protein
MSVTESGDVVVIKVHSLEEALAAGAQQDSIDLSLDKQNGQWPLIILTGSNPEAVKLVYTVAEWDAFVDGVKNREFDDMVAMAPDHRLRQAALGAAVVLALAVAWVAWRRVRRSVRQARGPVRPLSSIARRY